MQKKQILEIVAGLLVILATVGVIAAALLYEENLWGGGPRIIELTAQAPERGNWNMQEIYLVKGEPVRIKIRNIDTVSHGFAIPELGVSLNGTGEIKPGNVALVDFTPEKAGNFLFTCTTWCSAQHMQMTGRVIISEK